jgi:ribosomal protein L12E/L44/L45/RPP1/RPP2
MPVILATQEAEIRRIVVQVSLGKWLLETLSQKKPIIKRAGGVAQAVAGREGGKKGRKGGREGKRKGKERGREEKEGKKEEKQGRKEMNSCHI